MRWFCIIALVLAGATGSTAQTPGAEELAANVNGRYIVESVDIVGIEPSQISSGLRDEMREQRGLPEHHDFRGGGRGGGRRD